MTPCVGLKTTLENLSKELKLSKKEIKAAIGRLKKLKLLNESNGRLKKTKNFINTADQHLSAPALKKRQRQVLEKAICSLEMDSVEKRNITAWTMPVDPKKIPEAKKMIQEFHKSLCEFLSSGRKKKVYEMSISLFPLH